VLSGGILLILVAGTPISTQGQVAVVTHPDSPLRNLSLEELGRIFLGQVTVTDAGPVTLVEHSAARADFYRAVVGMAEAQVDRHWIGVVFRGGSASPPRKLSDPVAVRDFVTEHPGAIAFLALASVDASVRVITIDGRAPSDPGYPIFS